ncbi:glycosyl hydrolase family 61 [Phlyctema vagabunda]|uniref:Glycosyl hydrolase family 61 n=1 Tax=Phlyctema vagabunda TaxID=108571 RepID=A0ABR4PH05_9HELO
MSSITKSALFGLLASVAQVSAHGFVQSVVADGVPLTGWLVEYAYNPTPPDSIGWSTQALDLGFVAPSAFATGDIICHKDAKNAALSAKVAAGGSVVMQWNTWPESHKGPVIDYLANCNGDCSTVDKTALEFFKIDEAGLDNSVWASDTLIANNNSWTVNIPSTIAPGNYVLRHEMIALHGAGSTDGAQNYPQCINLEVTGSGTDAPAGTLGTALYTDSDAGILVNIYTDLATLDYQIPGPALYSGGSGSGSQPVATSAAASASAPVATSAAAGTSVAVTSAAVTSAAAVTSSAPVIVSSVPTTLQTVVASSAASSVAPVATTAPVEDEDACA